MSDCIEWAGRRDDDGYALVASSERRPNNKGYRMRRVSRLIVEAVDGCPLGPGEVAMHTCDNPPCVRRDHLRRGTQTENLADMTAKGRRRNGVTLGEASPHAKLCDGDVREIRRLLAVGASKRSLAQRFGVDRVVVQRIAAGQGWRHVA